MKQHEAPVWGTLTGIRPAKIAAKVLIANDETQSATVTQSAIKTQSATDILINDYFVSPDRAAMCVQTAQAALTLKETLDPRDVALYIGIPFCPTRCAYCSFVSNSVERSFDLIDPFIEILLQETEAMATLANQLDLRVISVYIGGGTPTALPESALEAVMTALNKAFDFSHLREFTVEAGRPDTVTKQKLEIITKHGAKRICINPQSMSAEVLSAIGRAHNPEDVYNAMRLIRQSDVCVNMDIIAGLPCDTPEGFKQTLDTVIGFKPESITVHTLSLKKGSRIMLEGTEIPNGIQVGKMLDCAAHRLKESNYAPYYLYRQKYISGGFENTGWSLPGHEGIYNICMMEELCTVLSLGGGAVTKLVSPDGRIERIFNAKYPREYITQADDPQSRKITDKIMRIESFYRANAGYGPQGI
ncbi:MAG: coproporphyrinogen dehydrogenase HemZ, partial [Oscillospiraceae bacterium]|nr:coproporphyrinogen dehydrogenase HemZ [Oscillospiraceae bacterium]